METARRLAAPPKNCLNFSAEANECELGSFLSGVADDTFLPINIVSVKERDV